MYDGMCTADQVPQEMLSDLTIRRFPGLPKTRRVFSIKHALFNTHYRVHNYSLANAVRGVVERVFYVKRDGKLVRPPPGNPGIFRNRLARFKQLIIHHMGKWSPQTREEFVEGYQGRKATIYRNALESLKETPVRIEDSFVVGFPKPEKTEKGVSDSGYLGPGFTGEDIPPARIISPRSPRFNIEVGKYIKQIEKPVYRAIAQVFGDTTVLKGYNALETGEILRRKWNRFRDPVAVGLDASRFDQHVRDFALQWSHSIYEAIYNNPQELARLLAWCINNLVFIRCPDGTIRYKTRGGRMSGDMDTALGNCLIMCAMVYAYATERGIDLELGNNGDDCTAIMERCDVERFIEGLEEWFLDMGFTMKVEAPVDTFEQIIFCRTQPVWNGTGWCMVRTPSTMDKDLYTILPIDSEKAMLNWFHDMGHCGGALNVGIPIAQAFYQMLVVWAEGAKGFGHHTGVETGMWQLAKGLKCEYRPITQESRLSYYLAFGITPDIQCALERQLTSLKRPPYTPQYMKMSASPHATSALLTH